MSGETPPQPADGGKAKPETGIQIKNPAQPDGPAPGTEIAPLPSIPPVETAAATPTRTPARFLKRDLFLAGLLLILTFSLGSFAARNADIWMHLASGRLLVGGEYQFGTDPFSFTTRDLVWVNHSWLFDGLSYLLYGLAGGTGLVVAKALVLVGMVLVLLGIRRPGQPLWLPIACIGLTVLVMSPRFLLQPACLSFLFFALTLFWLFKQGRKEEPGASPPSLTFRALIWPAMLFFLWVNLDSWFILGLAAVFFFWLGLLIQRWQEPSLPLSSTSGESGSVASLSPAEGEKGSGANSSLSPAAGERGRGEGAPRLLGLALLACLGTCLLNPHHYRVFTLPPELAQLVIQGGDLLPSWMTAGGQAVEALGLTIMETSPLSSRNWDTGGLGRNVAGMAYFVLLAASLASFFVPVEKGLKTVNWPRLLVWLIFAILGLLRLRLIPFFALVAGPIMVLNLQDYFRSPATTPAAGQSPERRLFSGRLLTGLALLILLILAWPGWLHAPLGNFRSSHRVAWTLPIDPSMHQAALKLKDLKERGLLHHGLNFSPDLACYCSWFAPGVMTFMDYRYSLFGQTAESYVRLQKALLQDAQNISRGQGKPVSEWRKAAAELDINYVVLNFGSQTTQFLASLWLDAGEWPPLYEDGRTLIFGWTPDKAGELASVRIRRRQWAFAKVPAEQRPPTEGTDLPREGHGVWDFYVFGRENPPLAMNTALFYKVYSNFFSLYRDYHLTAWQRNFLTGPLAVSVAVPASVTVPAACLFHFPLWKNQGLLTKLPDWSRPEGPILMIRSARRAVAENPDSPEAWNLLHQAIHILWKQQENYWSLDGGQNRDWRNSLRRLQLIASLTAYLTLQPDDPAAHEYLANIYLVDMNYLDVALDHLAQAVYNLDRHMATLSNKAAIKALQQHRRFLEQHRKGLAAELKKRRDDYDLRSAGLRPLEKFQLALLNPYQPGDLDKKRKRPADKRGMGLAKVALKVLKETQPELLNPQEKLELIVNQIRLLLMLGQIQEVREDLPRLKEPLGPYYWDLQLLMAAALGNYDQMDEALREQLQRMKYPQLDPKDPKLNPEDSKLLSLACLSLIPSHSVPELIGQMLDFRENLIRGHLVFQILLLKKHAAQMHLVRGLMLLEKGDIPEAEEQFQQALTMAGKRIFFPDRPIARRYLELIRAARE